MRRKRAARRFKPRSIRLLLVAESPPSATDRYFYFTDVAKHDGLWAETMKHFYAEDFGPVAIERARKEEWLRKLQAQGLFLIDAVKEPIAGSHTARVRIIRSQADALVSEIGRLEPRGIVLIKSTVWEALHEIFEDEELPVLNRGPIPFPGSGQQRRFHEELERLGVRGFIRTRR
ncbi:MAG: hypothetical protein ACRDHO_12605 [Actinomycetota bacterium]